MSLVFSERFNISCQGDALACPLPDALHPLLPFRLLLGFHSQEKWNRAGLTTALVSNFTISFPGLPYPLDNGSIGLSEEFEFVFPRGEPQSHQHLRHCFLQTLSSMSDAFGR